tara:strand:- start:3832 stop:4491 length:660 start_codon:yes stop_codon:yes gene_type:complete
MGLGRDNSPKTYLKLNTKEEKPVFKVYEKSAETGKYQHTKNETFVSGYFKSINFQVNEYKGETTEVFNLTITDDGMDYVIESSLSMVGRGILNTLCSYTELGLIKISLATRSKDRKSFPTAYLTINGDDRPKWKLSVEEQMDLTKVTKLRDRTDYDRFELHEKLKEMCSQLKPAEDNILNTVSPELKQAAEEVDSFLKSKPLQAKKEQPSYEEDDDLPF